MPLHHVPAPGGSVPSPGRTRHTPAPGGLLARMLGAHFPDTLTVRAPLLSRNRQTRPRHPTPMRDHRPPTPPHIASTPQAHTPCAAMSPHHEDVAATLARRPPRLRDGVQAQQVHVPFSS